MSKMVVVALLGGLIVLLISLNFNQGNKVSAKPVSQVAQSSMKQEPKEQLVKVRIIQEEEIWEY